MRFQLLTLFVITAIVAVGLAVFSPGLTHPESVVKILRQLNNIPPDADLRTVITTTLKPMRHADDCVETTTSKTGLGDRGRYQKKETLFCKSRYAQGIGWYGFFN